MPQPGACGRRRIADQALGVFVTDEVLRQIDRRQRPGTVARISNPGMMQPEHHVAQPEPRLLLRPQRDPPPAIRAIAGHVITVPHGCSRPVHLQAANSAGDVAHVESAHQIVRIADSIGVNVIRGQQQTGRLNSAHCQHDLVSRNREADTLAITDLKPLYPNAVARGLQPRHGGPHNHTDVRGGFQPAPIAFTEIRRTTEPLDPVHVEVRGG